MHWVNWLIDMSPLYFVFEDVEDCDHLDRPRQVIVEHNHGCGI